MAIAIEQAGASHSHGDGAKGGAQREVCLFARMPVSSCRHPHTPPVRPPPKLTLPPQTKQRTTCSSLSGPGPVSTAGVASGIPLSDRIVWQFAFATQTVMHATAPTAPSRAHHMHAHAPCTHTHHACTHTPHTGTRTASRQHNMRADTAERGADPLALHLEHGWRAGVDGRGLQRLAEAVGRVLVLAVRHQPLHALDVLALRLVVEDVRDVLCATAAHPASAPFHTF
eukprot:3060880-Rhodomonas_salina.1